MHIPSPGCPKRVSIGWKPNGGPVLTFDKESGVQLIEVQDGPFTYAFKDLNRNGRLDPYEDWRLTVEQRAKDPGRRLTLEEMAGLMLYPVQEPTDGEDKRHEQVDVRKERFFLSNQSTRENAAQWNNAMQKRVEKNDPHGIPVNLASDPRNTVAGGRFVVFGNSDMSQWPGNLGLAATFDPKYTLIHGQVASKEYRAFGITTALSPQVDLATEPRWSRFAGTFGEGSQAGGRLRESLCPRLPEHLGWHRRGCQRPGLGPGQRSHHDQALSLRRRRRGRPGGPQQLWKIQRLPQRKSGGAYFRL